MHEFSETIVEEHFVLHTYPQGFAGKQLLKFGIDLPEWLPASFAVAPSYSSEFSVQYYLTAELRAIDAKIEQSIQV